MNCQEKNNPHYDCQVILVIEANKEFIKNLSVYYRRSKLRVLSIIYFDLSSLFSLCLNTKITFSVNSIFEFVNLSLINTTKSLIAVHTKEMSKFHSLLFQLKQYVIGHNADLTNASGFNTKVSLSGRGFRVNALVDYPPSKLPNCN